MKWKPQLEIFSTNYSKQKQKNQVGNPIKN